MVVEGTIVVIGDNVQRSEKFATRDVVLTFKDGGGYDQYVSLQASFKNIREELDNFGVGQDISLDVTLGGRKWEKDGKTSYFNSLTIAKILTPSSSSGAPIKGTTQNDEDLPF
jgi:hypothetical protein